MTAVVAVAVSGCSDDTASPDRRPSASATVSESTPAPSESGSLVIDGLVTREGIKAAWPKAGDLPPGWGSSQETDRLWRDEIDAAKELHAGACGGKPQDIIYFNDTEYGLYDSAVSPDGSLGATLEIDVVDAPKEGPDDGEVSTLARARLAAENVENTPRNLDCYESSEAAIGDAAVILRSERFAHVKAHVGPVQIRVTAPRDKRSPSAEDWARMLVDRVRAVAEGTRPTARVTLPS
ncbi:hypothetical protein ACIBCM_27025 [Streptomyces sp. NPDC051018]|uniref:hypothetical protein n=1 Tax=Streptomyces sp. NPDC051018 TaxID=3365639 RepID=UPI0037AF4FA5